MCVLSAYSQNTGIVDTEGSLGLEVLVSNRFSKRPVLKTKVGCDRKHLIVTSGLHKCTYTHQINK